MKNNAQALTCVLIVKDVPTPAFIRIVAHSFLTVAPGPVLAPDLLHTKYVIQLYIRVSVVLSHSPARKEREKLDITLDSTVFVCRGKEI